MKKVIAVIFLAVIITVSAVMVAVAVEISAGAQIWEMVLDEDLPSGVFVEYLDDGKYPLSINSEDNDGLVFNIGQDKHYFVKREDFNKVMLEMKNGVMAYFESRWTFITLGFGIDQFQNQTYSIMIVNDIFTIIIELNEQEVEKLCQLIQ